MDLVIEPCHPLLTKTVFVSITKYITYEDIVQCKLVCKDWLSIIREILKDARCLTMEKLDTISEVYHEMARFEAVVGSFTVESMDFDARPEILALLQDHRFGFMSSLVLKESWLSPPTFSLLLRLVGPRLNYLDVEAMSNYDLLIDPCTIKNNNDEHTTFPLIKKLVFKSPGTVFDLIGIATTFPGLQELAFTGVLSGKIREHILVPMPKLLRLHIWSPSCESPWDNQFRLWTRMKLNLVQLELANIFKTTNMNLLKSFLDSQKETLEILNLQSSKAPSNALDYEQHKPKMFILPDLLPKVIGLMLPKIYMKNFAQVLRALPNVQRLTFMFFPPEECWAGILPKKIQPHVHVRQLLLGCIEPHCLIQLAKVFINLECLEICLCTADAAELIRVIFTEFKSIKYLNIVSSIMNPLTELGFLGLSSEQIQQAKLEVVGDGDGCLDVQACRKCTCIGTMKQTKNFADLGVHFLHITLKECPHLYITYLPNLCGLKLLGVRVSSKASSEFVKQLDHDGFLKFFELPTSSGLKILAKPQSNYLEPCEIEHDHTLYKFTL